MRQTHPSVRRGNRWLKARLVIISVGRKRLARHTAGGESGWSVRNDNEVCTLGAKNRCLSNRCLLVINGLKNRSI